MDKKIYLWNDLNLFFDNANIDKKLDLISKKYDNLKIIKSNEIIEWKNTTLINKKLICLGTRPKALLNHDKYLKIHRKRNSKGKILGFDDQNNLYWQNIISLQEINFCEDVIVEGKTIQYICFKLKSYKFKGIVNIHVFYANRKSVQKLLENNYDFKLNIYVYKYMSGEAIVESTLFCLYDIFYEKIGNISYMDKKEIYSIFLANKATEFILDMKKLKGEIEK